jgi:hypothetical protein
MAPLLLIRSKPLTILVSNDVQVTIVCRARAVDVALDSFV